MVDKYQAAKTAPDALLAVVMTIAPERRYLVLQAARELAAMYPAEDGRKAAPLLRLV